MTVGELLDILAEIPPNVPLKVSAADGSGVWELEGAHGRRAGPDACLFLDLADKES